jgi:two-component system sensor histidine kinase TctE
MLELQSDNIAVIGDAISLREALVNLINNAVTHGGGRMLLVRVLQEQSATRIEVVDDGPGIPSDRWEHMLEPFQSGTQDRNRRGSGLGLAIVQDVAKAHHGEIRFEQRKGVGFVAALILPGSPSPEAGIPS